MNLSIVIPMFNEEAFIRTLLLRIEEQLKDAGWEFEIVVVDDGSTDESVSQARSVPSPRITVIEQPENRGKGAAVRVGMKCAGGDLLLVQDADLEYDPADIPSMMRAAMSHPGTVVYGSRILGARRSLKGWRAWVGLWPEQGLGPVLLNRALTLELLMLTGRHLTDLLTGYKLYPSDVFADWWPSTQGFETDHEITMRLIGTKRRIVEVPADYVPRTRAMGKKIRARDGVIAMLVIFKGRFRVPGMGRAGG